MLGETKQRRRRRSCHFDDRHRSTHEEVDEDKARVNGVSGRIHQNDPRHDSTSTSTSSSSSTCCIGVHHNISQKKRRFTRISTRKNVAPPYQRIIAAFVLGTTLLLFSSNVTIHSFDVSSPTRLLYRIHHHQHPSSKRITTTATFPSTMYDYYYYTTRNDARSSPSSSSSVICHMTAVQKLEPLTHTSDDRRSRAISAMNRAKVEHALLGTGSSDTTTTGTSTAAVSTMFSSSSSSVPFKNHMVDPNNNHRNIRKGRPESVLGAMTSQTMARFLHHQSTMKATAMMQPQSQNVLSDLEVRMIAPYMMDVPTTPSTTTTTTTLSSPSSFTSMTPPAVSLGANEARPPNVKGIQATIIPPVPNDGGLPTAYTSRISPPQRGRKGVFQNLPKTKHPELPSGPLFRDVNTTPKKNNNNNNGNEYSTFRTPLTSKSKSITNGMDIKQYYRTELLTSDEEYALGMKIQFMDKCEQVHEGLASALHRLPTIVEWAAACGFTDVELDFCPTEADEQLRPVGSDAMFDDIDPNLFVGNGLAHQTGPGSGRGRAKRVPPLGIKEYYDDSEYRRQLKLYLKHRTKDKSIPRPRKSELVRPINRGTPTDFIEMLMTAHEAKQRMVQSNMRLVISIARKYYNAGVTLQDLVQEGSLGLSRAAEKFEPKKGFKFSTYASWWIQQAVFRSIAYHSRTIRLPVHVHNLLNRVRKVRQTLHGELGRAPTNEEIAAQLGMTRQKFNKMLHLTKQSISLEAPKYLSNPKDLGHESDDLLGETISKSSILEDEATPQKAVDHGLFHDDLKNIMKILDDDEHRVICARYGLHDGLTRTVTTVAAQMKQSKAWVRSQECRALRKLRRPWYEKKLKEHQDALAC